MSQNALLEITVPTFNRPDQLRENLPNLCRQAADLADKDVAVRVVDDTSTDPRVQDFLTDEATKWPFLTIERNPVNLGLERNVTQSIMTTTGEFGLVPGDDDGLVQGGLRALVALLRALPPSVGMLVLDKHRVDLSGNNYIAEIAGSKPESSKAGQLYRYDSPTDYCREVGPLSGLGLTSTAVFRSAPCMTVDPEKYLDLTVFPQVGIWLEALAHHELRFSARPFIVQRTMPAEAKLAEARGRREEKHMDPDTKHTHYLGVPYAAKLQRLIDAQALTRRDVQQFPERLLTNSILVEWIARLSRLAIEQGVSFRPEVLDDAARFFEPLDRFLAAEVRLFGATS